LTDDGILKFAAADGDGVVETDRERIAQVEVRVEEQGGRLIDLSQQMRDFERKVETKFQALDSKIDAMDTTLSAKFDGKFDVMDAKMTSQFKWLVGVNVTMWATTVAAILVVAGLVLARH
jgi:hypothetical protein